MLDNWLPFLIYGIFALLIPASMIYASFARATRPQSRNRAREKPLESGGSLRPPTEQRVAIDRLFMLPLRCALDRAPRPSQQPTRARV